MATLATVGHGTLAADEFAALCVQSGIEHVVDIRSYPGSRRHPHFGREAMTTWLPAAGVAYSWEPGLGGRRRPAADSPNVALTDAAFRGYADYMATAEFSAALDGVVGLGERAAVAVMCAESVWWRCHRRLVADALVLLRDTPVEHLFHDGRRARHEPLAAARVSGATLVYDVGVTPPLS